MRRKRSREGGRWGVEEMTREEVEEALEGVQEELKEGKRSRRVRKRKRKQQRLQSSTNKKTLMSGAQRGESGQTWRPQSFEVPLLT